MRTLDLIILILALSPFVYYVLAIYAGWDYFRRVRKTSFPAHPFTPPVSILKPVRGVDREAYENFASFCRQDYPTYEVLFAVADADDPVIPIIEKLQRDFPSCDIRLIAGIPAAGASPKMTNLCRQVKEAKYDLLAINDSDVRVEPDYLRLVAAPFADPKVGVVTGFFRGLTLGNFASDLDALGVPTDSAASTLVAWKFGGIDFALGWTMATTKKHLAEIGGFESMLDTHSDDFLLGNEIAKRGCRVELMPKPVWVVFPRERLRDFLRHELRWSIMLRGIRPAGYLAMVMTFGLPWAVLAALASPTWSLAICYLAVYWALRLAVAWTIGVWGLEDPVVRRKFWLVPVRDALNFGVYLASFFSNQVSWRGLKYRVQGSKIVPLPDSAARN
jgi:ceramide glucosyltransferase